MNKNILDQIDDMFYKLFMETDFFSDPIKNQNIIKSIQIKYLMLHKNKEKSKLIKETNELNNSKSLIKIENQMDDVYSNNLQNKKFELKNDSQKKSTQIQNDQTYCNNLVSNKFDQNYFDNNNYQNEQNNLTVEQVFNSSILQNDQNELVNLKDKNQIIIDLREKNIQKKSKKVKKKLQEKENNQTEKNTYDQNDQNDNQNQNDHYQNSQNEKTNTTNVNDVEPDYEDKNILKEKHNNNHDYGNFEIINKNDLNIDQISQSNINQNGDQQQLQLITDNSELEDLNLNKDVQNYLDEIGNFDFNNLIDQFDKEKNIKTKNTKISSFNQVKQKIDHTQQNNEETLDNIDKVIDRPNLGLEQELDDFFDKKSETVQENLDIIDQEGWNYRHRKEQEWLKQKNNFLLTKEQLRDELFKLIDYFFENSTIYEIKDVIILGGLFQWIKVHNYYDVVQERTPLHVAQFQALFMQKSSLISKQEFSILVNKYRTNGHLIINKQYNFSTNCVERVRRSFDGYYIQEISELQKEIMFNIKNNYISRLRCLDYKRFNQIQYKNNIELIAFCCRSGKYGHQVQNQSDSKFSEFLQKYQMNDLFSRKFLKFNNQSNYETLNQKLTSEIGILLLKYIKQLKTVE